MINYTPELDIRPTYEQCVKVLGGMLYLKENVVQLWDEKYGKETWSQMTPDQAAEAFEAMRARFNA